MSDVECIVNKSGIVSAHQLSRRWLKPSLVERKVSKKEVSNRISYTPANRRIPRRSAVHREGAKSKLIARLVVMDGLIHSAKRHEVFAMGPADGIMAFPDVVMGKIDGGGFPEAGPMANTS